LVSPGAIFKLSSSSAVKYIAGKFFNTTPSRTWKNGVSIKPNELTRA
jgi:hypothetical protein